MNLSPATVDDPNDPTRLVSQKFLIEWKIRAQKTGPHRCLMLPTWTQMFVQKPGLANVMLRSAVSFFETFVSNLPHSADISVRVRAQNFDPGLLGTPVRLFWGPPVYSNPFSWEQGTHILMRSTFERNHNMNAAGRDCDNLREEI